MPIRPLILLAALWAGTISGRVESPALPTLLIRGARVFDGDQARVRDVLVRGERIALVRQSVTTRASRVVGAAGMTLLPGLQDLHVHSPPGATESPAAIAANYAIYSTFGVIAVNEFSAPRERFALVRTVRGVPRIRLAVRIGVPGGHGTENAYTSSLTATVTTPAEARTAMRKALRWRPDVVKVFADGWRYGKSGGDRPDMDEATLAAIVRAAHRLDVPVMSHSVTLAGLKRAARAGVDAVAHGVGDKPIDAEVLALMRRARVAYVPTLAAYEPLGGRRLSAAEWDALSPTERLEEERLEGMIVRGFDRRRWGIMRANLRSVHAAGMRIGVGTDAGVLGVYPGWATLHELRLLVEEGLTPAEALRAATRNGARIMRTRGGRIRAGAPADLLLVAGQPDQRIEDLHRVRAVFVGGVQVSATAR